MEKFNHQEYRNDLATELKKIPNHKDRAIAQKKEEDGLVYKEAEKRHREDVELAMEKRDATLAEKLEKAGLVLNKKDYDDFVSDMKARISRYKEPENGGCTCSSDCKPGEEAPNDLAIKLLGHNFAKLAKYIATKDAKVTTVPDYISVDTCSKVSELLAAVEALQKMEIIVTVPQEKLPLSQFKNEMQATTSRSSDKSKNTIGYRNFLAQELKKTRDQEEKSNMLENESGSLVYKQKAGLHHQEVSKYVEELEPFKEKVSLTKAIAEKLGIDKSWGEPSDLHMVRYVYKSELNLKTPEQIVEAAKIVLEKIGKVFITLELNKEGGKSEVRMWLEEPVICGPKSKSEAIHYTPNIHGHNGDEVFLANANPVYLEAKKALDDLINSGEYEVIISNEYDLTSSGDGMVNGERVDGFGQRAIKSELITLTSK